jgi:D-3-phosphoglycerate dehydrogenase
LQGFLADKHDGPINYINAPVLAEQYGIAITQSTTPKETDYPNIISCKAYWDGGERRLDGVLFGNEEPRIVRINRYKLEAKPEGTILLMLNKDVPGVIGQIGTILSAYNVNIGEWRMGRDEPGGQALSVINLDSEPPAPAVDALSKITAVTDIRVVTV